MNPTHVKIKSIVKVTPDVLQIVTEKPNGMHFTPGQAADVSIHKDDWKNKVRPFTFTCLPENEYLEFTIKTYPDHQGVTNQLLQIEKGDELILHDVFGAIQYKGEGTFIAGGAGITPFISIFRFLHSKKEIGNNKLLFANKTKPDIILEDEFRTLLGPGLINILSDEYVEGYAHGLFTRDFIQVNCLDPGKLFYVCGPPPMMKAVLKQLSELHIDESSIIQEAI